MTESRHIHSHKVNQANADLHIVVLDGPGSGGASHTYLLTPKDGNPCLLEFQNGPIAEVGVNGITQEALGAVIVDRLEGFQSGSFACPENAEALEHFRKGLEALHRRTVVVKYFRTRR